MSAARVIFAVAVYLCGVGFIVWAAWLLRGQPMYFFLGGVALTAVAELIGSDEW